MIAKRSELKLRALSRWPLLAGLILLALIAAPQTIIAGEGGFRTRYPSMATLSDLPGTSQAWFLKPMYLNYSGTFSAQLPTAVGLAGDVDATTNTVALAGGRTFETTVLGGAHYTFAVALPYTWVDITAKRTNTRRHGSTPEQGLRLRRPDRAADDARLEERRLADRRHFADLCADGQLQTGPAGNTGLNYWTFDPTVARFTATRTPASTPCSMPVTR